MDNWDGRRTKGEMNNTGASYLSEVVCTTYCRTLKWFLIPFSRTNLQIYSARCLITYR